jgi:hypothetical protein
MESVPPKFLTPPRSREKSPEATRKNMKKVTVQGVRKTHDGCYMKTTQQNYPPAISQFAL